MPSVDYSPAQVTQALMQLVANGGNVKRTAEELIDDDFQVPESTLRLWKNDTHRQQFERLEQEYGKELEREAVEIARGKMLAAAALEDDVLERIKTALEDGKIDTRDLPATLRALTDTKAKTTDQVLKLTGRPTAPKDPAGNDLIQLVESMADRGLIRLAVGVELNPDAKPALPEPGRQNATDA